MIAAHVGAIATVGLAFGVARDAEPGLADGSVLVQQAGDGAAGGVATVCLALIPQHLDHPRRR